MTLRFQFELVTEAFRVKEPVQPPDADIADAEVKEQSVSEKNMK